MLDFEGPLAALGGFFESGKAVIASKNEVVVAIDEAPKGVYWVHSGHIKVVSTTNAGEERIDLVLKASDVFPIGWALGGTPVYASYIAMDSVHLRLQTLAAFNEFVRLHPEAIQGVIPKLLAAYGRIHTLNLGTARERVIHRLLVLSGRFSNNASRKANDFVVIDLSETQQEFASSVRLSRETAGRILNELEAENVIILGRKVVRVVPEKLMALLEGSKA